MKRISFKMISALLAAVFILSSSSAALALEYIGTETIPMDSVRTYQAAAPENSTVLTQLTDTKKLRSYLFEQFRNCKKKH